MIQITLAQFLSRFATLVMNGNGIPNKREDRHILFVSAIMRLESGRAYSERQLNEALREWSDRYGVKVALDHVTLRRFLVDEGYVARDAAGTTYTLTGDGFPRTVDPLICTLNLDALVDDARRAREQRKADRLRGGGG